MRGIVADGRRFLGGIGARGAHYTGKKRAAWDALCGEGGVLTGAIRAICAQDKSAYPRLVRMCEFLFMRDAPGSLCMASFEQLIITVWRRVDKNADRLPAALIMDWMCAAMPGLLALSRWYMCSGQYMRPADIIKSDIRESDGRSTGRVLRQTPKRRAAISRPVMVLES